jgi:hypothetical protein
MLLWNGDNEETHSIIKQMKMHFPEHILTKSICFIFNAIQNDKKSALGTLSKDHLDLAWNELSYSWQLAEGYALLNEPTEALKWLKRTIDLGFINYPMLSERDPFLNNIREMDEFKKLMKRVKKEWESFEI